MKFFGNHKRVSNNWGGTGTANSNNAYPYTNPAPFHVPEGGEEEGRPRARSIVRDVHNTADGDPAIAELVFILDRSGSMSGMEDDTVGGMNAVLEQHKQLEGQAQVSVVLFDHETQVLYDREDILDVRPLTRDDYQVRGCTALLDAVGGSIRHINRVQGYLPKQYRAGKVIFVITTDGYENASNRYSYQQVKEAVQRCTDAGWEFLFLGANIDAAAEAAKLGIQEDRAATYYADSCGSQAMHEAISAASVSMRCACPSEARMGDSWRSAIDRDAARRK